MSESQDERPIIYDLSDGIATVTLNRPDRLNALNGELRLGLFDAFKAFEEDDSAFVAIITGSGRAFCAGADLKEMAATGMGIPDRNFSPMLGRNVHVSKPVIAAVNGLALAGGFLLAQTCDLCIASESAEFGVTEVKRGRGVPWAVPLLWMIPQRVAMEMLLTGNPVSAHRAYEIGLVNQVTSSEDLMKVAREMASEIAANAPLSVRAARRALYSATEMGRTAAWDVADMIFEAVYRSDDAQEGPRAFTERRQPNWKGR